MGIFQEEYKKLNKAQKEAVDTIDGPVMVVAGPGTGKTQILALRIGNILLKTDIKADSVLCLTFTNSAVNEMKKRLVRYIGETGDKVNVFTFHSFAMLVIGEHFKVLGLFEVPKLLEDTDRAIFFEQILSENKWEYLRPRSDSMRYFRDLMSLASILKRERISSEDFRRETQKAIEFLERDEVNISTRGESKGSIKKEVLKEIESLKRTLEVVKFLDLYEEEKKKANLLDYDDVLEYLVRLVEISKDVVATIREQYLYVLVDEHQDSSRVQNEFLARVWAPLERPDIFVVGDDRQLIYGFSGASIDHFKGFKKTFRDAKLITLVDNYRSTQIILDASHALLKSVMSDEKLVSHQKKGDKIKLIEADTPEEEIVALALDLKEKIQGGLDPNDCAVLVPKNRQVPSVLSVLHSFGISVQRDEIINLFDVDDAQAFLRILKIISTDDNVSLAQSFLDRISGISHLEAHTFLAGEYMRDFSLDKISSKPPTLFVPNTGVEMWIKNITKWKSYSKNNSPESLISLVGAELSENRSEENFVSIEEITNTILGLLENKKQKNPEVTLAEFVTFLDKLASYGEHVPLVSVVTEGVKVLTMHSSKGLEFDDVWIAHMDERSLVGGARMGFTLPPSIKDRLEGGDMDVIKRKLYVAITRAKRFCTLSYAKISKSGGDQDLAKVIADLPEEVFSRRKVNSESGLQTTEQNKTTSKELTALGKLAANKYKDRYVSVSLLNNFFECPWKWYFRNLLQLPEKKSESLEFGNKVHSAIDKILSAFGGKRTPTKKELESITDNNQEVLNIITKWVKSRLPSISQSRENEQSISVKDERFPYLNIYGKIDLIENLPACAGGGSNSVRVTDFKTGSVRKKSEIEKLDEEERLSNYMRQLAMYSYLIKKSPKWKVEVSESRLEFLEAKDEKDSLYNVSINDEQIQSVVKDISDYDQLLKSGDWIKRPCNYNSYGKNTECEYCKIAQIYKN